MKPAHAKIAEARILPSTRGTTMTEANHAKQGTVPSGQDTSELLQEIERLRKIIIEMHKESERWRRYNFDRAGHPSSMWQDKPPPI